MNVLLSKNRAAPPAAAGSERKFGGAMSVESPDWKNFVVVLYNGEARYTRSGERPTLRFLLLPALALTGLAALAARLGASRWEKATKSLLAQLDAGRRPVEPARFDPAELTGLPAPVARYFRQVLREGQLLVAAVEIEHAGTFDMGRDRPSWKPFTSRQRVVTCRPGFVWSARMPMAPGLPVRVHDAYVAGEGILRASLWGLVPVVDLAGTPDLAQGELMRYLAETAWYPTALLPSQGVRWEAVDDGSARATLTDGATTVTLLFRFDEDGLVRSVYAEARGRSVGKASVPTPWEGRWSGYQERDGMKVPTEGEVGWILPEGWKPYWRGRIVGLRYEF